MAQAEMPQFGTYTIHPGGLMADFTFPDGMVKGFMIRNPNGKVWSAISRTDQIGRGRRD